MVTHVYNYSDVTLEVCAAVYKACQERIAPIDMYSILLLVP
jgi:hypothetical protein